MKSHSLHALCFFFWTLWGSCIAFDVFVKSPQRSGFVVKRRLLGTHSLPNQPTRGVPHINRKGNAPGATSHKMLKGSSNQARSNDLAGKKRFSTQLSNSVLASCDTLPAFPTAHGLLSPETVMRMEEMADEGYHGEPVVAFLEKYRLHGPLSCISMLSDPDVLPHLTRAMRDVL